MFLQGTLAILVAQCAVACSPGELVEARWVDGTFKEATITEVRDGPAGFCGQYKLSWTHSPVCDDSTDVYWGDRSRSSAFCLVSRDAIKKCKQELCKRSSPIVATTQSSNSSQKEDSSGSDFKRIALISCLGFLLCCIISATLWLQSCCARSAESEEDDEEKASGGVSPFGKGGALWSLSPSAKGATLWTRHTSTSWVSSPMAKRIANRREAGWPPRSNRKVVALPAPVAAVVVEKQTQPQNWSHPHNVARIEDLSGCAPGMVQTPDPTLRQAAQVCAPRAQRTYAPLPQPWRQVAPESEKPQAQTKVGLPEGR